MKTKALITATAVLLVAVMCLATASYAWFTSDNASTVASLNLEVSAGDSGLTIAAANAKNNTYSYGTFKTTALTAKELTDNAILPSEQALSAVSGNGVYNASTNFQFFKAPVDTYDATAGTWAVASAAKTEYVLLSFYVKYDGTTAANYDLSFTSTLFSQADFYNTVKIGYSVKDATYNDGVVTTTTPGNLTICKPSADATATPYAPIVALPESGTAYIKNDTDNSKYTCETEGILATSDVADDAVLGSVPVDFTGAGAKLITVAIWLEGQDYDCQGKLNVSNAAVSIALSTAGARA